MYKLMGVSPYGWFKKIEKGKVLQSHQRRAEKQYSLK